MRYAIGTLTIFAALCAALLFSLNLKHETLPASLGAKSATTSLAARGPTSRQPPDGRREYVSSAYKFSLFYPANMKVSEYDEGEGASTITFEDDKTVQAFQIFIVPYADAQVNEPRFRRDEPSGVRNDPTTIAVDGAVGAAFYSKDAMLGDTREIWFIKNGFLYEATALKSDGPLLDTIMQQWKFI